MTVAVLFWTAASAAHSLVTGFWDLAIARALLGFGEGATFPGGLRAVMQSLPPNSRARGVAIAYSGGSLGAIVAPLIVTPINSRWGWQAAFIFTGLIGAVWVLIWQLVSLRADIRQTLVSQQDTVAPGEAPHFRDRRAWAFMFAYALGGAPLGFIIYYSASFLTQTFQMSQQAVGQVLWIPPLGWEIGYFFWGWVSDRSHRTGGKPRVVQRRLMTILAVLSLVLAVVPYCQSFHVVMFLKFLAMAVAAGFIIVSISYATHIYSVNSAGLIAGLSAGSWSAGVAIMSPVFGACFDAHAFDLAYGIAALLPAVGLVLWWSLAFKDEPGGK
jgi:ACS family hexuronate transporter-like MFS transporter